MTAALILAALFLPLVGFIAGALWERRKHERLSQARTIELADLQLLANNLGAENMMLRHHIDETGKVLPPRRVGL